MIKGSKHLTCEERLEELGLFGLGKKRLKRDPINVHKHPRRVLKQIGPRSCQWCPVMGQEVTGQEAMGQTEIQEIPPKHTKKKI